MKRIKGDLIELALAGEFDLIVHGCNCMCTMGAGIAKTIKSTFPAAYTADKETIKGDESKLGDISIATVALPTGNLIIVNAYTQFDYKGRGLKANYNAIRQAFRKVKERYTGLRIGFPAIGAGLAGGDWSIIATIIEEELKGEDFTFVEFDKTI